MWLSCYLICAFWLSVLSFYVICITLFCFSVIVLRMAMVPDCLAYWTLYVFLNEIEYIYIYDNNIYIFFCVP